MVATVNTHSGTFYMTSTTMHEGFYAAACLPFSLEELLGM